MRNIRIIISSILLSGLLMLQPLFGEDGLMPVRAFPGAEGFGAYSKGGRGGKVYHITTLEDGGQGSLRSAIEAQGPRIIVFDISGTIRLKKPLAIGNPFITIAGQTAPGDGICLRDATLAINTDHVVIRYLRCRLGDEGLSGDAISINSGRNIIIDHCSASWSTDEVLSSSTYSPVLSDVTVQWCFITEALNAENHGYGSLIRGCHGVRYSYHHNLYAHNRGRNPRPGNYDNPNTPAADPNGLLLDFRSNVIYNWEGSYAGYNADKESITKLNYVGNYLIPGPNSVPTGKAYQEGSPNNRGYFSGNYYNHLMPNDTWSVVNFDDWNDVQISAYKQSVPFESGPISTENAKDIYQSVIQYGGACLPQRDTVDRRIIENVQNGKGRIINSQKEVGNWPDLRSAPAPHDSDGDGMPDNWEQKHKLNPNDAADGSTDADLNGYTNVEEYLNSIG
ncbi:MAG: hypothetical protein JW787_00150 [Sedimentisphaerales bacterium]|nr:hypothetical protein [Sedimentisphaerales bacterium]